jgi:hypothetical protein
MELANGTALDARKEPKVLQELLLTRKKSKQLGKENNKVVGSASKKKKKMGTKKRKADTTEWQSMAMNYTGAMINNRSVDLNGST